MINLIGESNLGGKVDEKRVEQSGGKLYLCYKCYEKLQKIINIRGSLVSLEKKRKGFVFHIIPLIFPFHLIILKE